MGNVHLHQRCVATLSPENAISVIMICTSKKWPISATMIELGGRRPHTMHHRPPKDIYEAKVFRAFAASACLPVESISPGDASKREPDVLCTLAGVGHCFELSEVFWERPDKRGDSLAKGLKNESDRFSYPLLQSLEQSLERKAAKTYELHDRPCSLLLYYATQNPYEPYESLFEEQEHNHIC
jgi:hypothetical protein